MRKIYGVEFIILLKQRCLLNNRYRCSFTLLELLIVVVIVAILAAVAIPGYFNVVEKTKIAKAEHYLSLIAQANKMCHEEEQTYAPVVTDTPGPLNVRTPFNNACGGQVLGNFIEELGAVPDDDDWNYSGVGTANTFTITATKADGSCTITVDQNNNWVNGC